MLPSVTSSVPAMLHGVTYRIRPPVAAGRFYPAHPDGETARMIGQRQWESLTSSHACGYRGIAGLLQVADARGLSVSTIDLRNSGDTAGGKHWVVGYGSFVVEQ